MTEQAKAEKPEAPTPEVQVVTGEEAKKLLTLSRRVSARKGSAVGLLASVADRLHDVYTIYRMAALDTTHVTQQEISLLLAFTKRLERRSEELALKRVSGMTEMAQLLEIIVRQLDEADKGGYGLRALQRQAEVDRRTLERLRVSIKARVQESAAVLAELEQAADPIPGMRLVSGRQRALNAKIRKKQKAEVPLPPGVSREDIAVGRQPLAPSAPGILKDMTIKQAGPTSGFSR